MFHCTLSLLLLFLLFSKDIINLIWVAPASRYRNSRGGFCCPFTNDLSRCSSQFLTFWFHFLTLNPRLHCCIASRLLTLLAWVLILSLICISLGGFHPILLLSCLLYQILFFLFFFNCAFNCPSAIDKVTQILFLIGVLHFTSSLNFVRKGWKVSAIFFDSQVVCSSSN